MLLGAVGKLAFGGPIWYTCISNSDCIGNILFWGSLLIFFPTNPLPISHKICKGWGLGFRVYLGLIMTHISWIYLSFSLACELLKQFLCLLSLPFPDISNRRIALFCILNTFSEPCCGAQLTLRLVLHLMLTWLLISTLPHRSFSYLPAWICKLLCCSHWLLPDLLGSLSSQKPSDELSFFWWWWCWVT